MEQKQNTFLETEKLSKLMCKYSLPCVISLLVAALYNIVDQIFIANAKYLGSYGNAANTVVFPLTVLALAIAVMIGDGCCAFVSINLGSNNKEDAKKSITNSIILCLISSFILTFIYLVFSEEILTLFGGKVNNETYIYAKEYFFYISIGLPFYMFGQAINPIIRSDGNPNFAMLSTISGAIINIILDPVFIYVFKWGMKGAAIATVLGQIFTAFLSIYYLLNMKTFKFNKIDFKLEGKLIRKFIPLGMTSFLSQVSLVISMAAVQNSCIKYGAIDPIFSQTEYAQIPLAALGIVMKFFQIAISISIGLAAGCIPIVGYNIGANRKDRAKMLFNYLLIAETIVGFAFLIIVEFLPLQIANLFGATNESIYYTKFIVKCFRIYLCMLVLATINKGTFIYLQALGKALTSTIISLVREIIFGVFLPIIMPIFFGLDGLLWSFPVSDILTFIITFFFIKQTYKELSDDKQVLKYA